MHIDHPSVKLSVLLAVSMLLPSTALASPVEEATLPAAASAELTAVSIAVTPRGLGERGPDVERRVRDLLSKEAKAAGLVVTEQAPRDIQVVLAPEPDNGGNYRVRLGYRLREGAAFQRETFSCEQCDAPALLDLIAKKAAPVFKRMKATPPPSPKKAEPEPALATGMTVEPKGPPDGVGVWGAGLLLTTLGAGLALGGATGHVVLAADKEFDGNPPAAWAFLGAGSAMLAAGIPMIIFGDKRMRRDRRARANASYDGRTATLGLTGTF